MVTKSKNIAKSVWWFVILTGVLGILFGLFAVFWPGLTLATLVLAFGVFVVAIGAIWLILSFTSIKTNRVWWLSSLFAVFLIVAGIYLIMNPSTTVAIFAVLAAIAIFVQSLGDLVNASYSDSKGEKTIWIIAGLVGVVLGFVLIFYPTGVTLAFVWILGLYALIRGIFAIIYAVQARGVVKKIKK